MKQDKEKEITELEFALSARYTRKPYDLAIVQVEKQISDLND